MRTRQYAVCAMAVIVLCAFPAFGQSRVPAADATQNRTTSEVIGNKSDAAVTTIGTTASLMAYLKGLFSVVGPSATTGVSSVVGAMTDAAVTAPTTDKTAMGYLKGGLTTIGAMTSTAATASATDKSAMAYLKGMADGGIRCAQTALLATTATSNTNIFTYSGSIVVESIIGIVQTTEMAAAQTRIKLTATADALSATDICAALDVTGDTVGTTYNITGTVADALVEATNGVAIAQAGRLVLPCTTSGVITVNNADAANAGRILWQILYRPLEPGATVTAA